MNTKIWKIDTIQGHETEIEEAAEIIQNGGLVALPTETVYGLGANALNANAVAKIYEAKGRPSNNPLIIHVPNSTWLKEYCDDIPEIAYTLTDRFWPGPLTIILKAKDIIPKRTTGGLNTVAVRCPSHKIAQALIESAGVPIAAPSANTSGRPSCTTAQHVIEDMYGKIEGIIDGGSCEVGVESTIIDLTSTPPQLLRPGGMALEDVISVIGDIKIDNAVTRELKSGEKPKAPGMAYRHYAPKAPVTVFVGKPVLTAQKIKSMSKTHTGIICFSEFVDNFGSNIVESIGSFNNKREQAQRVFDALRVFDETDVTEIFAQCPDDSGLGMAVANRLKKAAGFNIIEI